METKKRAIKREIKEETGLLNREIKKIKKFNVRGRYDYPKEFLDRKGVIGQTYTLYAVEIPKKKVKINKLEHSNYKWLTFKQALKKLTYANQRGCFRVVDKFLNTG